MKRISKLFVIMLVTALVGHSFYIYRFFQDGTIFTGPNDGLEQMLPMQLYLYEKWSRGKWFYDIDFGLGGDYYTDLAYYYSTNVIFFFNMLIVKFLSLFMDLKTDTITFWAKNAFFISIIKSAIAGMFSYLYLRTTRISKSMSVLFAYLFITSAIYFRFTLYWSFFSDIFIFLPMLLFGIERFIQYKDRKWFIIAVTLSLINNFYFAYYQLLFGVIYFVIRNIWQSEYDVVSRSKQWLNLIIMTLLSVGMSSFAFYYGVRGFLSNSRATYDCAGPPPPGLRRRRGRDHRRARRSERPGAAVHGPSVPERLRAGHRHPGSPLERGPDSQRAYQALQRVEQGPRRRRPQGRGHLPGRLPPQPGLGLDP